MQIKKKTIQTVTHLYDVLGLSKEQYESIKKTLNLKTPRAARRSSKPPAKPKPVVAKAPKKLAPTLLQSIQKSPSAKKTNQSSGMKCPIGGEMIAKQGAWNHIQKHGREQGMTVEQAKEVYNNAKG